MTFTKSMPTPKPSQTIEDAFPLSNTEVILTMISDQLDEIIKQNEKIIQLMEA